MSAQATPFADLSSTERRHMYVIGLRMHIVGQALIMPGDIAAAYLMFTSVVPKASM